MGLFSECASSNRILIFIIFIGIIILLQLVKGKNLLILTQSDETSGDNKTVSNKDKLVALLTNQVGYSRLYNNQIGDYCWQPLADVDINLLRKIVGRNELTKIEKENRGKPVLHCYRIINKANRHGYSNYNPCMHNVFKFTGYDDRH